MISFTSTYINKCLMIKFYKTATCQLILNITNVENHNTQHLSNKMVQKKKHGYKCKYKCIYICFLKRYIF